MHLFGNNICTNTCKKNIFPIKLFFLHVFVYKYDVNQINEECIFMFVINLLIHRNWFIPIKPKLSNKNTLSMVSMTYHMCKSIRNYLKKKVYSLVSRYTYQFHSYFITALIFKHALIFLNITQIFTTFHLHNTYFH